MALLQVLEGLAEKRDHTTAAAVQKLKASTALPLLKASNAAPEVLP